MANNFNNEIVQNLQKLLGTKFEINVDEKEIDKLFEENKKNILISLFKVWDEVWKRSMKVTEQGINLEEYDDAYFLIIENLCVLYFGQVKARVIFWWVYERHLSEGVPKIIDETTQKEYIVKTPVQLYNCLKNL